MVSDLGSLLLQVFQDFALQSPHLLLVGGQAVILLLDLDAPYGRHTPDYSCGQVPGVPATTDTCGVGHGHQGA